MPTPTPVKRRSRRAATTEDKKPEPARRSRSRGRIDESQVGDRASSVKELVNKAQQPVTLSNGVPIGANGLPMREIVSQMSETVPVAQFANVVIGPICVHQWIEDNGPEDLRDQLRALNELVAEIIAEERETVEESVRAYNRRKAEEEEAAAKGKRR